MKRFSFVLAFLAVTSFGFAQTVTVDAGNASPDNTTTFNSLQAAITSFQASGDVTDGTNGTGVGNNHGNAAPDIINITTATPIDESIVLDATETAGQGLHVLDEALTVQGDGVRAIVCIQGATVDGPGYGLIYREPVDLTLKNIAFIPSMTTPVTAATALDFLQMNSAISNVINMDNVVVTSNDGSNQPVTVTGLDNPDLSSATSFPSGVRAISLYAFQFPGSSITLNATHLVISSFAAEGSADALRLYASGATINEINIIANLGAGCVISNVPGFGVACWWSGYANLQGTKADPIVLANVGGDGVWLLSDSGSPTQPDVCEADHVIFANIAGSALKEQETGGRGFVKSASNCIFANCGGPAIELYANGALVSSAGVTDTVNITSCTILNCGNNQADPGSNYDFRAAGIASPTYTSSSVSYNSNRNVNIVNTIITGSNSAAITGLYNSSTGTYTIDYSALAFGGIFGEGLFASTGGPSTINVGANVISDSPIYALSGAGDYADSSFADVRNPAFAGKGQGGIDLAGGADFIGDYLPPASATSWTLYE